MTKPGIVKACPAILLAAALCATGLAQGDNRRGAEAADFAALDAATGKALFERVWVAAPASTASADGLGPHYNARSCAACHPAGGGGSAEGQLNFLISDPVYGEMLQRRAVAGLPAEALVTVEQQEVATLTFEDGSVVALRAPVAKVSALEHGELLSAVSIRRAPSLRGRAQLEDISREQLETLADPADHDGNGISGRLSLREAADGSLRLGRFGWKATGVTLEEQTAQALSLDMGLGTSRFPSAAGDCTAAQQRCLQAAGPAGAEPEVSDQIVGLLLSYLRALPPPPSPATGAGAASFAALGCSNCHVAQLAGATGPLPAWTDLLLHDMGPGLADAPATGASAAEWRSAPLWGLGEVSGYLHDGRAQTLEEAILWHGGEAEASVTAFRRLNTEERERLLAWLRSL